MLINVNGAKIEATVNGNEAVDVNGVVYVQCENCGDWVDGYEAIDTVDGVFCEACASDYVYCERCGEWHPSEDVRRVWAGGWEYWCIHCCYNDAVICEGCGEWHHIDCTNWYERHEAYYCEDCKPEFDLIGDYHDGNPDGLQFHGDAGLSVLEGFIGCELEYFGNGYDIAEVVHDVAGFDFCHFEDDSSVDLEIVTQPMTIEYILANRGLWEAVFKAIDNAGGYCEDGSGFHVHISRSAFGQTAEERATNLAKIMMLFSNDDAYNRLGLLAGRTSNVWAEKVNGSREMIKRRASADRCGGHSVAVNLEHRDTVEFRLGKSVDNWEDFIGWLLTLIHIVQTAPTIDESVATCFDNWMQEPSEEVKKHFSRKGVVVNEPKTPLTIADYEAIIFRLCDNVQAYQCKLRDIARATGVDWENVPKITEMRNILQEVTEDADLIQF